MDFNGKNKEYLLVEEISSKNCFLLKDKLESGLTILWNLEGEIHLRIDEQEYHLANDEIVFLTEYHQVEVLSIQKAKLIKFNRSFYCISDHDSEVSCRGILFFGASQVPRVKLPLIYCEQFDLLWKVFLMEMNSKDHLQYEMLQMLVKRFIILCTRIYKEQDELYQEETGKIEILRTFNYLVEIHFRKLHTVSEYAELLNRSPKTLSNLFSQLKVKTPLQIIHDRILLEAYRLLTYTEKPVKEIAYELGYEDLQSFSRFFKVRAKSSPKKFREKKRKGRIDNSLGKIA